jgi:hypothetical protein
VSRCSFAYVLGAERERAFLPTFQATVLEAHKSRPRPTRQAYHEAAW